MRSDYTMQRLVNITIAFLGLAVQPAAQAAPLPASSSLPGELTKVSETVSIEKGGRPLPEVLQELSRQTNLALSAGEGLADQKVTVLFKEMRLADAAHALAAAVDGVWRQQSDNSRGQGAGRFRLEPSEKRKAELELSQRARRAAEARRDQVALAALLAKVSGQRPKPNPERSDNRNDIPLFLEPEPIFPIVGALPREVLARLIHNANESIPAVNGFGPDLTPVLVIPAAALPPAQRSLLTDLLWRMAEEVSKREGSLPQWEQEYRALAERPERLWLEFWSLRYEHADGLGMNAHLRLRAPSVGWARDLRLINVPLASSLAKPDRLFPLVPENARSSDSREETPKLGLSYGSARMDRALLEIARTAGVNLAADHFTKPGAVSLLTHQRPLRSILQWIEQLYSLQHHRIGSTLVFRSRDWASAYDREPPVAVTDRWERQKRERGILTLDDYVAAATGLHDAAIATLANYSDERGNRLFQLEVPRLARHRHVLRGYASLDTVQRNQVSRRDGLAVARLSAQQMEKWLPVFQRYPLYSTPLVQRARLRMIPAVSATEPLPRFLLVGLPDAPALDLVGQ